MAECVVFYKYYMCSLAKVSISFGDAGCVDFAVSLVKTASGLVSPRMLL